MKKGYKRLLLFQVFIILILSLSSFVSSILTGYIKAIVLGVLLVLFFFLFGFEKDNHRYWKSACVELIIYLLSYFILFYLFGIIISFAKTNAILTLRYVITYIIPIVLIIILQEILRYMMVMKSEGSKILTTTTCLFFIAFNIIGLINEGNLSSAYSTFYMIAIYILPAISSNILCTYLSRKSGYKPPILYLLVVSLYRYVLPIIPNPNEYLYAIIELIVPMIFLYLIYHFFNKYKDEDIIRDYHKTRLIGLIIPTIVVLFFVYITSGYFYYHAIAVGSGSMTPNILKGDVVVIEKKRNFDELEVGRVIAYRKGEVIVVHRLIKKVFVDGEYYMYTKGDNNDFVDDYKITEDMYIGIVSMKIPYIGYPTVWLNNL